MDMEKTISKLTELFANFTYVKARVQKTVQEEQFEPYVISLEQGMIVPIEDKSEAYAMMVEELDNQMIEEFKKRGIILVAEG